MPAGGDVTEVWALHDTSGRVVSVGITAPSFSKRVALEASGYTLQRLPLATPEMVRAAQRVRELETALDDVLREREDYHRAADNLADAIVSMTVGGDVVEAIGEHSNCNDPWANAVELAENAGSLASPEMIAVIDAAVAWSRAGRRYDAIYDGAAGDLEAAGEVDTEVRERFMQLLDEYVTTIDAARAAGGKDGQSINQGDSGQ